MNDFIGKICPYCKTEFQPGDDIVLCSVCEMPHHKDCWIENQGCTTFGCLGTTQRAGGGGNYQSSIGGRFCDRCGAPQNATDVFCAHCGNSLRPASMAAPQPPAPQYPPNYGAPAYGAPQQPAYQPTPPAYSAPQYQAPAYGVPQQPAYQPAPPAYSAPQYQVPAYGQTPPVYGAPQYPAQPYNPYQPGYGGIDPDQQRLIGTNEAYYVQKFQRMKAQGSSASWNWPAFWVAPYWLFYRKMYGLGAVILAADLLISLVGNELLSVLSLIGYILFGVFANSIYMSYLENKANQAKTMMEPQKSQFIMNNGGVNSAATILVVVGRMVLFLLISAALYG